MARPKSTTPPKGKMNISVSDQTRLELEFISQHSGKSVSQLISEWAKKEARKTAKAAKVNLPDVNQMTIEEV